MLSDEENEAIMTIANSRDEIKYKYEKALEDLVKLEKEKNEKIRELESDLYEANSRIADLMNERQKYRIELVSEDKIEERGDSIDESTMLKQIKLKLQEKNIPIETLLAEFERLEDLEDDLTTVYLNGIYDGEKKVEDKIKERIEEIRKEHSSEDDYAESQIYILQSLLEKE